MQGLFCSSHPPGRLALTVGTHARHLAGIFLRRLYLQTESKENQPRGDFSRMVNGAARILNGSSNLILRAEIWIPPHLANTVLMQLRARHRRADPSTKEKPPHGGFSKLCSESILHEAHRHALAAIGGKANSKEAQDHHHPGRGFRYRRHRRRGDVVELERVLAN